VKQATKTVKRQQELQSAKMTQVSLDDSNPPNRSSAEIPGHSLPLSGKDTKKQTKDGSSGRLKKAEQRSIAISNQFNPLEVDVGDEMEISSQDLSQTRRPPPKPPKDKAKIKPVTPP